MKQNKGISDCQNSKYVTNSTFKASEVIRKAAINAFYHVTFHHFHANVNNIS